MVASPEACTIEIRGNRAFLSGDYPLDVVREATSYFQEGYRFSPAYKRWIWDPITREKRRAWDGRVHLFDVRTRSMPSGLVPLVVRALKENDAKLRVSLIDERTSPAAANDPSGFRLHGISFGEGKFDYQLESAKAALGAKQGILKVATNGGKTEIACAITNYLKVPTLFVVPGVDLLHQTRARFAKRLNLPIETIGIVGDQQFFIGEWVTIATVDSLFAKKDQVADLSQAMESLWQLLFVDECHTAGSDTFYEVLDCVQAFYRFGLSGTPLDRTDGASLRLIAQTGEVVYEVSNKLLIERGVSVPVTVEIKKVEAKKVTGANWKAVQRAAITENEELNGDIVKWVPTQLAAGRQVVVLVKEIAHGQRLEKLLRHSDAKHQIRFIYGGEDTAVRQQVLEDFTAGQIHCLVGTSILYQGIDTPNIDVLVFADLGKSRIVVLQAIGRGLRARSGKTHLLVRDYANFCHKWTTEHSLTRLKTYKSEKCFNLTVAT